MNTTESTPVENVSYVFLSDEVLKRTFMQADAIVRRLENELAAAKAHREEIATEHRVRRLAKSADLPDRIDVNFTDADRENARKRLVRHADGTYTVADYNDEPSARHFADEESAYSSALGIENVRRIAAELPAIFPLGSRVRVGAGTVEWEVVSRSDFALYLENPAKRNTWGNPSKRYVGMRHLNDVRRIHPA